MDEKPQGSPIIYDATVTTRFNDLDPYGHVNAAVYLDLVASTRLIFFEKRFGMSYAALYEKGLAFYLRKSEQEFLRGIEGMHPVRGQSFIESLEGPRIVVDYRLSDPEANTIYSKGKLEYLCIDPKRKRPYPMPDWFYPYIFE